MAFPVEDLGALWEDDVESPNPFLDPDSFITCSSHRNLACSLRIAAPKRGKASILIHSVHNSESRNINDKYTYKDT